MVPARLSKLDAVVAGAACGRKGKATGKRRYPAISGPQAVEEGADAGERLSAGARVPLAGYGRAERENGDGLAQNS